MRKIDIERSRDYYKECLKNALVLLERMAKAFEKMEIGYRERIKELEGHKP